MSKPPKVFISYSHDSQEHQTRVQELADRLRQDGTDCEIDQYEPFPSEGWPAWMGRQLHEADFVLVACTRTYFERLTEDERPGVGLGARFEGRLIEQYLYEAKGQNQKFIPILFDGFDANWIPKVLGRYSSFRVDTEEGYTALFRYLTKQPEKIKPDVGPLKYLPSSEILEEATVLTSAIGRILRRQGRWIVAVALLGLAFSALGWTWYHQPSRLYDKGRQAMAILEFPRARIFFEESLAKDDHPLVRSALAEALMRLGKSALAKKESESALKQNGKLSTQDRLLVQARYERIGENWDEALFRYRELQKREPANVEYAIGIAESQISLDRSAEALVTIKAAQKTSTDPRLDLLEGMAAYYLSDFSRQVEATSRAIKKAEKQGIDSLASEGYLFRGTAFLDQAKLDRARDDFDAAEKRAGENLEQLARARNAIAGTLSRQGNLKEALSYYEQAREAYKEAGNKRRANEQGLYLANIYDQQGKLSLARHEYEEALGQDDDQLSRWSKALARGSLGTIMARQGDLTEATESLEMAITLFEEIGDQEQRAAYSCRLSGVYLENLELELAKNSLKDCSDVADREENPFLKGDALISQGYLLFFQGHLERAWKAHQTAIKIYAQIDARGDVAQGRLELATVELEREQYLTAGSQAEDLLDYFSKQNALDELAAATVLLARVALAQGDLRTALSRIHEAKRRAAKSESLVLRVQVSLVEARALAATGNVPEAHKIIQRELSDSRNLEYPRLRMETRLAQGEIEVLHGDRKQGRELLSLLAEDARERGFKLVETKAVRLRAGS